MTVSVEKKVVSHHYVCIMLLLHVSAFVGSYPQAMQKYIKKGDLYETRYHNYIYIKVLYCYMFRLLWKAAIRQCKNT